MRWLPCFAALCVAGAELEIHLRPQNQVPRAVVQKESGCRVEYHEVQYVWTMEASNDSTIPQLVQFRVDCREPDAELTELQVFDKRRHCGRVDYTKYLSQGQPGTGKKQETVREENHGPVVVLRSGDVIDFRCILSPIRLDDVVVEHLDDDAELEVQWQATFAMNVKLSTTEISVVGVEVFKISLPLVATAEQFKRQMDLVYLRGECREALKMAYDWKLAVAKSQANRHRVKFESPKLGARFTRLTEFEDENLTLKEMGTAGFANGLQLAAEVTQVKCENIPEDQLLALVQVAYVDWADQGPSDRHSVALELTADVATLPQNTQNLEVTVFAWLWGRDFSGSSSSVQLPVVNAGTRSFLSSPRIFWMQVITVVSFVLLGLAYFYKNRQRRAAPPPRRVRATVAATPHEVEMQSPSKAAGARHTVR